MGKFDGETALVTGATSGIGLATAKRLAADGATVIVTGRRKPNSTQPSLSSARTPPVCGDVSNFGRP